MQKVAIVAGGYSGEYNISMKTAAVVLKHLDRSKYQAYIVEINRESWMLHHPDGVQYAVNKNDFSVNMENTVVHFDVVFNAIHGDPGENGKLLGYFDMLQIPYTSCGALESALTFNKYFCNQVVRQLGGRVAPSLVLYSSKDYSSQQIVEQIGLPAFVKPNNGGSSVATSKVNKMEALPKAIEAAFKESKEVLVEGFIQGRELTMGVFEKAGRLMPLPITEIRTTNEFFDYEAKYNDALNEEIMPAPIPHEWAEEISHTTLKLYRALHLKGVVRFDYIYSDKGLYFLEVNTVPGLSEQSIVPKQYAHAYGALSDLFDTLIKESLTK